MLIFLLLTFPVECFGHDWTMPAAVAIHGPDTAAADWDRGTAAAEAENSLPPLTERGALPLLIGVGRLQLTAGGVLLLLTWGRMLLQLTREKYCCCGRARGTTTADAGHCQQRSRGGGCLCCCKGRLAPARNVTPDAFSHNSFSNN